MSFVNKALSAIGLQLKSDSVKWTDERGHSAAAPTAGEIVTASSALSLSAVWACANLISGTVASLPFEVMRRGGQGVATVAGDHSLHRVIYESPNYEQTALDFWDFLSLSIELWGNGYARIERNGDRIISLHPIMPEAISVRRDGRGVLQYAWSEDGSSYTGTDRDVLHIRGAGGNALGGMSVLRFGREAFSSALAADRAAAGMFKNGMRPSSVLKFKEWLTGEQRAIAEERLAAKYLGAVNSGRPFIAEGGVDYQQLSISPEDAQMLETRQFSVEEICRYFQVPPVLIGHAGSSTAWPTSVEQQVLMFQKFYLRKRLKRIEQAVAKQLLTAKDRAGGYSVRFNMEGLLRGDSAARAAFYVSMTQIGAMSINDVCDFEGWERKPGGDVPRVQMQNVPITGATNDISV